MRRRCPWCRWAVHSEARCRADAVAAVAACIQELAADPLVVLATEMKDRAFAPRVVPRATRVVEPTYKFTFTIDGAPLPKIEWSRSTFSTEKRQGKVEAVAGKKYEYLVLLKMDGGAITGVVVGAATREDAVALADEIGPKMGTDYLEPLAVASSFAVNGELRFADLWALVEVPPPPRKREFKTTDLWRP